MKWITTNYLLIILSITFLSAACGQAAADKKEVSASAASNKMYVEVKAFKTANGWGYAVYADGKLYIQQSFIPGVAGTHSFLSQQDALKASNLVLKKMSRQQRFPVVSKQELQAVGIALPNG